VDPRGEVVVWSNIPHTQAQWAGAFAANNYKRIGAGIQRCSDVTIGLFGIRNVGRNDAFRGARGGHAQGVAEQRIQAAVLVVNAELACVRRLIDVRLRPLPANTQSDQVLLLDVAELLVPQLAIQSGPPIDVGCVFDHSRIDRINYESFRGRRLRRRDLSQQSNRRLVDYSVDRSVG